MATYKVTKNGVAVTIRWDNTADPKELYFSEFFLIESKFWDKNNKVVEGEDYDMIANETPREVQGGGQDCMTLESYCDSVTAAAAKLGVTKMILTFEEVQTCAEWEADQEG